MPKKTTPFDPEKLRRAHLEKFGKAKAFRVDPEVAKRIKALTSGLTKTKAFTGTLINVNEAEDRDLSAGGISTGFPSIDDCLTGTIDKHMETVEGSGLGIPRGRIIEIMGPEACLDAETFVQFTTWAPDGSRMNSKGGTIERLWERFHGKSLGGDRRGKDRQETVGEYTAPCMNEEGRIFHNRVVDVVKTGSKECFELLTESGQRIVATGDHRFWVGHRFLPLSKLREGGTVYVHNRTPFTGTEAEDPTHRAYHTVKFHPVAGKHEVTPVNERTRTVRTYTYHRLLRSRAVVEAQLNKLSLSDYLDKLNGDPDELDGFQFLTRDTHVHHKDEDVTNDDPSNLVAIEGNEHNRKHAEQNQNNLRFVVVPDEIVSIEPVGSRETYDLKMFAPFNNYVANGIVVHNSGKTSLALMIAGTVQKSGGVVAIIDMEHALDVTYARGLGVDMDSVLLTQPDHGEEALTQAELYVRKGVDLIIVDSVAALIPEKEAKGEMGSAQMGSQARLMSQACRKLSGLMKPGGPTVIFINQIRMKLGVMFGNPETTPGGNALKFYASIRCDIRKIKTLKVTSEKDGERRTIGTRVKLETVKNKIAPPHRYVIYDILFSKGVRIPSAAQIKADKAADKLRYGGK